MGPTQINGLPAHILLIHVVVIVIPLAALALVLSVAWPTARARLGIVTPLLALVGLAFVPVTTHAGEWLEARLPRTPLIAKHVQLGHTLLPWALGLFVVAALQWVVYRYVLASAPARELVGAGVGRGAARGSTGGSADPAPARNTRDVAIRVALVVLALVVAIGSVVQVYRIGDSGAQAAWKGVGSS